MIGRKQNIIPYEALPLYQRVTVSLPEREGIEQAFSIKLTDRKTGEIFVLSPNTASEPIVSGTYDVRVEGFGSVWTSELVLVDEDVTIDPGRYYASVSVSRAPTDEKAGHLLAVEGAETVMSAKGEFWLPEGAHEVTYTGTMGDILDGTAEGVLVVEAGGNNELKLAYDPAQNRGNVTVKVTGADSYQVRFYDAAGKYVKDAEPGPNVLPVGRYTAELHAENSAGEKTRVPAKKTFTVVKDADASVDFIGQTVILKNLRGDDWYPMKLNGKVIRSGLYWLAEGSYVLEHDRVEYGNQYDGGGRKEFQVGRDGEMVVELEFLMDLHLDENGIIVHVSPEFLDEDGRFEIPYEWIINGNVEPKGIDSHAFDSIRNILTGAELPEGVNEVPAGTFSRMPELRWIRIPEGTTVRKGAVTDSPKFTNLHVQSYKADAGNTVLEDGWNLNEDRIVLYDRDWMVSSDYKLLNEYVGGERLFGIRPYVAAKHVSSYEGEVFVFPDYWEDHEVTALGSFGGSYNSPFKVTGIVFPKNLRAIDHNGMTFDRSELTEPLILPETLEVIGGTTFVNITLPASQKSLVIPESVSRVGSGAFYNMPYDIEVKNIVPFMSKTGAESWAPDFSKNTAFLSVYDSNGLLYDNDTRLGVVRIEIEALPSDTDLRNCQYTFIAYDEFGSEIDRQEKSNRSRWNFNKVVPGEKYYFEAMVEKDGKTYHGITETSAITKYEQKKVTVNFSAPQQ